MRDENVRTDIPAGTLKIRRGKYFASTHKSQKHLVFDLKTCRGMKKNNLKSWAVLVMMNDLISLHPIRIMSSSSSVAFSFSPVGHDHHA